MEISAAAEKQLSRLDRVVAKRVARFLLERVAGSADPRAIGKALQGNKNEFWSYRVGDYRVICEIHDQRVVVVVIDVDHRSKVYR
ncbi:type II toxin-antitoxin system RelE/ParE family toxin [Mesorhizobium microcysteis]|uniref:Type II toxin-antitoxin system RelE/ParE family toxin n=1 Tax=Neoaquamicrobium microcysteis TaxID=2682781 RepID=A0A5D4GWK5_9HYPH|nr:type II toxin-antitoxin system RelE/ParE family toxin [Mesorhizobium microcysteis]